MAAKEQINKPLIYTAIIAFVLTSIWAFYRFVIMPNNQTSSLENNLITENTEVIVETNNENLNNNYIQEYSEEILEENKNKNRVLYFYANWCPTCKPVHEELQTANFPEDLVVFKINYNDTDTDSAEKELARKYNITYQHTFVILDSEGNVVDTWNGGGLDDILSRLSS